MGIDITFTTWCPIGAREVVGNDGHFCYLDNERDSAMDYQSALEDAKVSLYAED